MRHIFVTFGTSFISKEELNTLLDITTNRTKVFENIQIPLRSDTSIIFQFHLIYLSKLEIEWTNQSTNPINYRIPVRPCRQTYILQ